MANFATFSVLGNIFFSELCEDVQANVCREVGITRTTFPNFYTQPSQSAALVTFNKYINESCSRNATLLYCNLFFSRCSDDGKIEYPCKSLCLGNYK